MLRVVIDTNLVISGTAKSNTIPHSLLEGWRKKEFLLITSIPILSEIKEVLDRKEIQSHFFLKPEDIQDMIQALSTQTIITSGALEVDIVKDDPDDNKFIAAAIEGSASYIISGDRDLLDIGDYEGIKIMKARNFLKDVLQKDVK